MRLWIFWTILGYLQGPKNAVAKLMYGTDVPFNSHDLVKTWDLQGTYNIHGHKAILQNNACIIYISILSHILHVCRHMMQIYIYMHVYIYKRVYVMHEHVYVYLIVSTKYVSTYWHHKIRLDWFWTCAVSVKTLWPTARNSQVINWSLFSTRDGGQCVVAYSKPIEDRKVYSYIYIYS